MDVVPGGGVDLNTLVQPDIDSSEDEAPNVYISTVSQPLPNSSDSPSIVEARIRLGHLATSPVASPVTVRAASRDTRRVTSSEATPLSAVISSGSLTLVRVFVPVTLIQRKWKSIRACYTRELLRLKGIKSGSAASRKKQYIYFELLGFLETTRKQTTSSLDEEAVNIEENDCSMTDDGEQIKSKFQESSRKRPNPDQQLIDVLKKKVLYAETPQTSDETNEDRLFLLSMVSDMMKVPVERKLKLRGDIISLVAAAQAPLQQGWTPESNSYNNVPGPSWQQYSAPPTMHQHSINQSSMHYRPTMNQPTMHQPPTFHQSPMNQLTFLQQPVNHQTNNFEVPLERPNTIDTIQSPSSGRTSVLSNDNFQSQLSDSEILLYNGTN
ncbi:hypothetical protein J6590_031658 [Homalodisca vitripennis]|nr:hypothetical protein J6590_031658 [Homalodisca vitripennis]